MALRFRLYLIKAKLSINEFSQKFIEYTENNLVYSFDISEEIDTRKLSATFSFENEVYVNQIDENFEIKRVLINNLEKINFDMYQLPDNDILLIIRNPIRNMSKFFDTLHKFSINQFSYRLVNLDLLKILKILYQNYPGNFILNSLSIDNWNIEANIIGEVKVKFSNSNIQDEEKRDFLEKIEKHKYVLNSMSLDIINLKFKSRIFLTKNGTVKFTKDSISSFDSIFDKFNFDLTFMS